MPSGYLVPRGCDQHGERQQLEGMWSADSKGAEEPLSSLVCSVLKNGKIAARDGPGVVTQSLTPPKRPKEAPSAPALQPLESIMAELLPSFALLFI